jgi:integral membrane protein
MQITLPQLRVLGLLEGLSCIALFFIAMPLKYLAGAPEAVRIVGMLHGILFMVYVAAGVRVAQIRHWSLVRIAKLIAASIVPFGTFVFDRSLKLEADAESSLAGS